VPKLHQASTNPHQSKAHKQENKPVFFNTTLPFHGVLNSRVPTFALFLLSNASNIMMLCHYAGQML
jgi:hypothetical protein